MSDLNGINSQNSKAVIRAKIYSGILREQLEPELIAMNYVDVINSFPDGDKWEDVEMGNKEKPFGAGIEERLQIRSSGRKQAAVFFLMKRGKE